MNVACTQCPAKYAVTDDKVRGRKVRIKCKRCGSPIIVDGTQFGTAAAVPPSASKEQQRPRQKTMMGGLQASPELLSSLGSKSDRGRAATEEAQRNAKAPVSAPAPSFRPASVPAPVSGQVISRPAGSATSLRALESKEDKHAIWSVAISEIDVREMPGEEIVGAYAAGLIDQYTYIWRDTMTEWLVPFDVPEIAALLRARGFSAPPAPTPASPLSQDSAEQDAQDSEANQEWRELLSKSREEPPPTSAKFDDVTVVMTQQQIEAAHDSLTSLQIQRGEFQSLEVTPTDHNVSWPPEVPVEPEAPVSAKIAKEEEVAPPEEPQDGGSRQDTLDSAAQEDVSEPVFEQFKSDPAPDSGLTGARSESSVLFSLRALVQTEEDHERVTEDSLVGGSSDVPSLALGNPEQSALDSALIQAVSQPPSAGDPNKAASTQTGGSGKWLGLSILVLLAIAGISYVVFGKGHAPPIAPEKSISSEPAKVTAATPSSAEPAQLTPPPPPLPEPSVATSPNLGGTAGVAASAAPIPPPTAPASAVSKPPVAQAERPATPPVAAPTPSNEPEPSASEEPEPPPAGPFNEDAAKAALAAAAANASINCKALEGRKGIGKVTVTFAPSGRATQAVVSGDFAGTPTGSCIATAFRNTQVQPFSGQNVNVSKSVTIR